jgi:predicted  nucleic acid-binding Zn-ribbon protein
MKISRLFYLFVVTLGCSSPKVELTEANKIHLENAALFEVLENKLDSLHKVGTRENLKMDIQNLMHELEGLEENMVEVPGFEHEHHHEGHNHSHETPINYTDDQILAIQKEVKSELLKIKVKVENFK